MKSINDDKTEKWYKQLSDCVELVLHDNEMNFLKNSHYIKNKFTTCDYDIIYCAVAYHDKDSDTLEGRSEFPHYHVILYLQHKISFRKYMDLVLDLFKGFNENQVGIQKIADLSEMSRYILHRGYPDKYQYDIDIVETNNMDLFSKYITMTSIKDVFDCITVVEQYHYDLKSIMQHVCNYPKWKTYIKDLIADNRYSRRY